MIVLEQVRKEFPGHIALRDISLKFDTGKTTVLIGPSGCGKSTVIRLITGLLIPDTGSVSISGEVVREESVQRLRQKIGYVIQEGGLFPHLTVRENVSLMPRYLQWDTNRKDCRIAELAELVHLTPDLFDRYPAQLSGGQKQRISLMRALMLDPEILLLDEPLAALDPMIRYNLQAELKTIFEQLGKTVLMVTHDMSEAAYFGDKIVMLKDGEVIQQGHYSDLLHNPAAAFVKDFINAQRDPLHALDDTP